MVAKHHGRYFPVQDLRQKSFITREGVSLLGISDAAEAIGLRSVGVKVDFEKLEKEAPLPCIVHWYQRHFIVVYKISKDKVYVADPAKGLTTYSKDEFLKGKLSDGDESIMKVLSQSVINGNGSHENGFLIDRKEVGIALLLEPTPEFYNYEPESSKTNAKA